MEQFRGTTILAVRRGNSVVIGGDGQVSMGNTVMKGNARKVRRLYQGKVLAGFAGGTADAFTLFELFEAQLEKHQGHLVRSAVELAKAWRTERALRRLEALLAVVDRNTSLVIVTELAPTPTSSFRSANPKSTIFTSPSLSTMMLCGLRSRWRIPERCARPSPRPI